MWNSRKSQLLAVVLLVACSGFAVGQTDEEMPKPTTTTTTAKPTTPKPTTTTTKPAPPAPTTTTTTTTTTTPAPITTPAPTPAPTPKPEIGKWNSSCAMIQMAAQFNLTYVSNDDKNMTILYNLPKNATVDQSSCFNQTEQIALQWGDKNALSALTIEFEQNSTSREYFLNKIYLNVPAEGPLFPKAKDNQTIQLVYKGKSFGTPLQMSYHCTREQHLNMTETIVNSNATEPIGSVTLTNVQWEAFFSANSSRFSIAKDCDAIDTPDVVPIAVGIALATLIVIVLIAYLIARRRSTARGYTSF